MIPESKYGLLESGLESESHDVGIRIGITCNRIGIGIGIMDFAKPWNRNQP